MSFRLCFCVLCDLFVLLILFWMREFGEKRVLTTGRKRELKRRAWTVVGDGPELAAMPIDDGTADR